jgi:hypothetical protein
MVTRVFFIIYFGYVLLRKSIIRQGVLCEGEIIDYSFLTGCLIVVEYNGEFIHCRAIDGSLVSKEQIGKSIVVFYNPDSPDKCSIEEHGSVLLFCYIALLVASLFIF